MEPQWRPGLFSQRPALLPRMGIRTYAAISNDRGRPADKSVQLLTDLPLILVDFMFHTSQLVPFLAQSAPQLLSVGLGLAIANLGFAAGLAGLAGLAQPAGIPAAAEPMPQPVAAQPKVWPVAAVARPCQLSQPPPHRRRRRPPPRQSLPPVARRFPLPVLRASAMR